MLLGTLITLAALFLVILIGRTSEDDRKCQCDEFWRQQFGVPERTVRDDRPN